MTLQRVTRMDHAARKSTQKVGPSAMCRIVAAAHPVLRLQRAVGNQAVRSLLTSRIIQRKVLVNRPGDEYEQEADRVADAVMRMPAPASLSGESHLPVVQRRCLECEEERIQPKAVPGAGPGQTLSASTSPHELPSGGQPLAEPVRAFFGPRFGHEFGAVRIHTDARAAASAQTLSAAAFTLGQDIVFGRGQYAPHTSSGRRLLAHELMHVIQQMSGAAPRILMRKGGAPAFPKKGLRIIGSEAKDLVAILAGCSGMTLELDKTDVLVIKAEGTAKAAKSGKAREAVKDFLKRPEGVIVNAEPTAPAVAVGAFGHEYPGYQTIDVTNVKALAAASGEKKGLGECDAVLHEIAEAFAGRRLSKEGKLTGEKLYLAAHAEGVRLEKDIRKELGLPEPSPAEGDFVHFANESEDVWLLLDSIIFGSGKDLYTQLKVVRFVLGPITEGPGGEKKRSGDYNVVASHVVKGEVRFKTDIEAIAVFNRYASSFGFKPITVPVKKSP